MKSKLYQDYDALAYKPHSLGEERGAINHIKKTKQKTKGLEIVFDPKQHKEFVTGFRKRKQQRRKVANKQLEKKAKQQRVEQRAERRKEMKQQLGLPDDYGVQDSDGEQDGVVGSDEAATAAKAEVKQYQQSGFTTTVSVTNLNTGYSSDEEAAAASASEDDVEDEDAPVQAGRQAPPPHHHQHKQQQSRQLKSHKSRQGSSRGVKKSRGTKKRAGKARKGGA